MIRYEENRILRRFNTLGVACLHEETMLATAH